jgi:hypothetical protein
MTGLIVKVKLEVEPAFRLRESKVPVHIDYLLGTSLAEERLVQGSKRFGASDEKTPLVSAVDDTPAQDAHFVEQRNQQSMQKIEDIARSAEHVRMWWYPQTGGVIVARANRTYEVSFNRLLASFPSDPMTSSPPSRSQRSLAIFSTITSLSFSSGSLHSCLDTRRLSANGRGG